MFLYLVFAFCVCVGVCKTVFFFIYLKWCIKKKKKQKYRKSTQDFKVYGGIMNYPKHKRWKVFLYLVFGLLQKMRALAAFQKRSYRL